MQLHHLPPYPAVSDVSNARQAALARTRGQVGEKFALSLYQRAKFAIIAIDLRIGRAQIDILAKRNDIYHFVEVKYRRDMVFAHHAIKQPQIRRISTAAEIYMRDIPVCLWQIDYLLIDAQFEWQRIDNVIVEVPSQ